MATKTKPKAEPTIMEALPDKRPTKLPLILWIAASVAIFIILLALVHLSHVLDSTEESIYAGAPGWLKPVVGFMHHEELTYSTEDVINKVNLVATDEELKGKVKALEESNKTISGLTTDNSDLKKRVADLETKVKSMEENAGMPALPTAGYTQSAPLTTAPAAGMSNAQAAEVKNAILGKDYRKVSKIVDAMTTDQAIDVLNILADEDIVKTLVLLKDKRAAELIQAFEPARAGKFLKMILDPNFRSDAQMATAETKRAVDMLNMLDDTAVADIISKMKNREDAAKIIQALDPARAAKVVDSLVRRQNAGVAQ